MSNLISEEWIKREIKKSILKEVNTRYDIKNTNNINEGIGDLAFDTVGFVLDEAGGLFDMIPLKYQAPIKDYIFTKVANSFGFSANSIIGMFVRSCIAELSFTKMGDILEGEIECSEVTELVSVVAGRLLTKFGIKKLMVWILQHYDLGELTNILTGFDPFQRNTQYVSQGLLPRLEDAYSEESISDSQANNIMNSLIGMGLLHLIEGFVRDYIIESVVPAVSEKLCEMDIDDIRDEIGDADSGGFVDRIASAGAEVGSDVGSDGVPELLRRLPTDLS